MKQGIEKLVHAYDQFQHDRGKEMPHDNSSIIAELFSKNFKKLVNGKEIVSTREGLEQQLADAKAMAGFWSIEVHYTIPSACGTKCTRRYTLKSAKAGDFDVFTLITSHDGKQIDVIDEIYYQIEK